MHWFENALANVNLEALNDIMLWVIGTLEVFNLDVGTTSSSFDKNIPISGFLGPIVTLALFLAFAVTILKLTYSMLSPYEEGVEEPAAIIIRGSIALAGVKLSTTIFQEIQQLFNKAYMLFVTKYKNIAKDYTGLQNVPRKNSPQPESTGAQKKSFWDKAKEFIKGSGSGGSDAKGEGRASVVESTKDQVDDSSVFNFFGGDKLIKPDGTFEASLGVLILELIIGCTLLISFMRLVLEVYERYVLIGVMYYTSPLAFAAIAGKGSHIFKNWLQMLASQYILMCTNLMFLGGFIAAWYNTLEPVVTGKQEYLFESSQAYFGTMFTLIGWLLIGQKLDQHLKGLGLSTAQTGAGIMGALAGGAIMARTALGAIGSVGGTMHRTATGQTMVQRAWEQGVQGRGGGLVGAVADKASPRAAERKETAAKQAEKNASEAKYYEGMNQMMESRDYYGSKGGGKGGGDERPTPPASDTEGGIPTEVSNPEIAATAAGEDPTYVEKPAIDNSKEVFSSSNANANLVQNQATDSSAKVGVDQNNVNSDYSSGGANIGEATNLDYTNNEIPGQPIDADKNIAGIETPKPAGTPAEIQGRAPDAKAPISPQGEKTASQRVATSAEKRIAASENKKQKD